MSHVCKQPQVQKQSERFMEGLGFPLHKLSRLELVSTNLMYVTYNVHLTKSVKRLNKRQELQVWSANILLKGLFSNYLRLNHGSFFGFNHDLTMLIVWVSD